MSNRTRLTNFCFTLNNYTEEELANVRVSSAHFVYIVYGFEMGENGTPHLQGYGELKTDERMELRNIKELPGFKRMHIEKRFGTQEQAITYCKKEGIFEEFGSPKECTRGQRTDIKQIRKIIQDGGSMRDVLELPNITYNQVKLAEKYLTYRQPKNIFKTKQVFWFHGTTGTGKTRKAFDEIKEEAFWISAETLRWFDGYSGQKYVIFDDFRKDFCTYHNLLRLTDGYPLQVPIKGGYTAWEPTHIWITSCFSPEALYDNRGQDSLNQLLRRITDIVQFPLVQPPVARPIPTIFQCEYIGGPLVYNFEDGDNLDTIWMTRHPSDD